MYIYIYIYVYLGICHHDYDDDGERAAGGRLAELLRLMGVSGNRCIHICLSIIRATRGRNQIVFFSSLLEGLRPCAIVVQKKRNRELKKMKNTMCQKNVTTDDGWTDATVIPAWTQLIVTLGYNNLVSNVKR
jgi:hypothetical protein